MKTLHGGTATWHSSTGTWSHEVSELCYDYGWATKQGKMCSLCAIPLSWWDSCSRGNPGFPNWHYYWFSSIKLEPFWSFWVPLNVSTILFYLKTAEINHAASFERFSEHGYTQCSWLEHTGATRFYRQQNTHDEKVQSIINSKWLEEEYDLLHSPHQSMERWLKLQWGLSPTSAKEIKRHSSAQSCKSSVPWFCSVTPF